MIAIFRDAYRAFRDSPWMPPAPGQDTSIPEGHRFRISMTSAGCYGIAGPNGTIVDYRDADYFDEPRTVEVRAWNLRDALTKAAALPLGAWFPEEVERMEH